MRFPAAAAAPSTVVVALFVSLVGLLLLATSITATETFEATTTTTTTEKRFLREKQHHQHQNKQQQRELDVLLFDNNNENVRRKNKPMDVEQQQQQQRAVSVDYNKKMFNKDKRFDDGHGGDPSLNFDTKIVGGEQSSIGQFPYFVDMNIVGCGGSLIAPRVVMTAAHCDESGRRWVGQEVLVGAYRDNVSSDDDTKVTAVRVDSQIIHPDWEEGHQFNADIQLLRLSRPVFIDPPLLRVSQVDNDKYHPQEGTDLTVLGVGRLWSGGDRPDFLHHVVVPVVNVDTCDDLYGSTTIKSDTMFCAGDAENGGIDSCQGDSGGPIVYEESSEVHIQEGVVSWGHGCASPGKPGVYAKVGWAFPWIRQVVCDDWNVGSDFCGPTEPPTPTQPPSEAPTKAPLDCGSETLLDFRFNTDDWGSETSWELRTLNTNDVIDSGSSYSNDEEYQYENCIEPTLCHRITIFDANNDGFCCGGDPYIQIIVDGTIEEDLSSGGEMRWGSKIEFEIGDCEDFTSAPTQSPTEFTCDDTTIEYEWNFRTDAWGSETFWEINDSSGNVMASGSPFTYNDDTPYYYQDCLPADNCYTLTLRDTNTDGFCCCDGCQGTPMYELIIDGQTIWEQSGTFNWQGSTQSGQFGNACDNSSGGSTDGDGSNDGDGSGGSNDGDGSDGSNDTPSPVTSAPVTAAPIVTPAPVTSAPITSAPVTAAPIVTPAPVTPAPVTSAPVTAAPIVTPAPVTDAPVSPTLQPIPEIPPPPIEGLCADSTAYMLLNFTFETDGYGSETSWDIIDKSNGTTVASSKGSYQNFREYEESDCFARAGRCYVLTIYDAWGDGFCCGGYPFYQIDVDGETVIGPVYGHNFGPIISFEIGEGCDDQDDTTDVSAGPTPAPAPPIANCGEMELEVDADSYGGSISVIVFDGLGNTVVEQNGFTDNVETTITEQCIDMSDCSLLRVSDNSSNNSFGGTIVVKLDGAILYEGSNFGDGFEVRMGSACAGRAIPLENHYEMNHYQTNTGT